MFTRIVRCDVYYSFQTVYPVDIDKFPNRLKNKVWMDSGVEHGYIPQNRILARVWLRASPFRVHSSPTFKRRFDGFKICSTRTIRRIFSSSLNLTMQWVNFEDVDAMELFEFLLSDDSICYSTDEITK